jgi:hypothetical protein
MQKTLQGCKKKHIFFANLGILFLGANLGILPMLYDVKRRKEHVMERPEVMKN